MCWSTCLTEKKRDLIIAILFTLLFLAWYIGFCILHAHITDVKAHVVIVEEQTKAIKAQLQIDTIEIEYID